MKKANSIKFSLMLTDIFLCLLVLVALSLPFLVTWYVEYTGRLESLATTIMVTCYPCAPFTGLALFYLRKVLKNVQKGEYSNPENVKNLKYMSLCCIMVALITLIAGRFYLPFFLVAGTFLFLALLIFVFRNIFINAFKN
ncbi:MAG: DUF2975 domain-containing protein [Clostridia bacterium]|nr:DUF2975 domain-containing protein [Clostridia bacterium]MBR6564419.1 DUF2975 domain-containing protein [Clostridia bacterium]MBR6741611.1 DUF2975 domain-containing protein [Clostridia bacterium]